MSISHGTVNDFCVARPSNHQVAPRWQRISDLIFTAAFSVEMCLKLAATGLYYFTDTWNWLDAIVVSEVGKNRGQDATITRFRPAIKLCFFSLFSHSR